jgi:hypothetical protein
MKGSLARENDLAGPLAHVGAILPVLAQHPRAAGVLETASSLLDEYASHFTDEAQQHAFLYNVPSHRELMHARDRVENRE